MRHKDIHFLTGRAFVVILSLLTLCSLCYFVDGIKSNCIIYCILSTLLSHICTYSFLSLFFLKYEKKNPIVQLQPSGQFMGVVSDDLLLVLLTFTKWCSIIITDFTEHRNFACLEFPFWPPSYQETEIKRSIELPIILLSFWLRCGKRDGDLTCLNA